MFGIVYIYIHALPRFYNSQFHHFGLAQIRKNKLEHIEKRVAATRRTRRKMGKRNMVLNMIGFCIFAMGFMIIATEATEYTVGDSFGWDTPTNESFYRDWATNKTFYVGDILIFNISATTMLSEVSKADFDNCTQVLSGVGGGGIIVSSLTLDTSGPRYFICPIDNDCVRGQKLSINVESTNSGAPSLQPHHSVISQSIGIFVALAVYFLTNSH
ncbi:hypothetical protein Lal_00031958 [Lupinus albus]|uniref:Putative cupredoxin n=1 Tax=Lupinus albus TaxID=3870 RepID=A0A6A5P5Y8_LUPAL|nr:putative cupredoxin [Lupinus albus]KAF1892686.1 hypothetical protein Lal_00031958 [Lupinus albus]